MGRCLSKSSSSFSARYFLNQRLTSSSIHNVRYQSKSGKGGMHATVCIKFLLPSVYIYRKQMPSARVPSIFRVSEVLQNAFSRCATNRTSVFGCLVVCASNSLSYDGEGTVFDLLPNFPLDCDFSKYFPSSSQKSQPKMLVLLSVRETQEFYFLK